MSDDALSTYLSEIAWLVGVLLAFAVPWVIWAMVRYRRAGPPVAGAVVAIERGAYRGSTARPWFGTRLPWLVYAALLASTMGAAFVLAAVGYELWTQHSLGSGLRGDGVFAAAVIACSVSRLLLLDASIAIVRRRPSAARRTPIAVLVTLGSVVLYAGSVLLSHGSTSTRVDDLVDLGLYTGGLLVTALLVVGARRAMHARFRA